MNWQPVSLILTGISTMGGVLYFALRSFIRAELAEQRAQILEQINGNYLRKDLADAIYLHRANEQAEGPHSHCPYLVALARTKS